MNKNSNTPKRKRLTREVRLKIAAKWVKEYNGKKIILGYAKWFGVDKICAINELKSLGIYISEILEKQVIESYKLEIEQKKMIREKRKTKETPSIIIDSDDYFAYIAGYTSNGVPFGLTYEEYENIKTEE
jgi:hypothetical protein